MKNIIISNPKKLEEIKKRIRQGGKDNLHVITDFDRTLTKGKVKGDKKVTSIINLIALGGYLTPDYPKKAHALFDKYYPIEHNVKIPLEKRKKEMVKWWTKHNQLLIKSGLNLEILKDIVKKNDPHFRENILGFFNLINKKNVPLIILSASRGVLMELFLEKYNYMNKNIHIISNYFEFDKKGNAIGSSKPLIHVFNKNEISVKHLPIYNKLLKRKNIILLGDNIGDVGMIKGFPYNNLIKIGFLNENTKERLKEFKKNYDVVILNDGDMSYVNKLLGEIVG